MIIIKDESSITIEGKCDGCHRVAIVRPVEAVGLMGEGRGFYRLCFDCFGPRIFWKKSEGGKIFVSPARSITHKDREVSSVAANDGAE